jgi:hypothetical protein
MKTRLRQTFEQAVSAFNSADYTGSLGSLLHPDVVMNEVDDPKAPPHAGKNDVLTYLNNTQSSKQPQFFYVDTSDPKIDGPNEAPGDTDNKPNVRHAQVNGIGKYQDISVTAPGQNITAPFYVRYYFLFRKEASWLLVHATATPL